jgi:hypothetical protein
MDFVQKLMASKSFDEFDNLILDKRSELIDLGKIISKFRDSIKHYTNSKGFDNFYKRITDKINEFKKIDDINPKIFKDKFPDKISEIYSSIYDLQRELRNITEIDLLGLKNKIQTLKFQHFYGGKTYIRFGKFPKSERSGKYIVHPDDWETFERGSTPFTKENGISVYKCIANNDKWIIVEPKSSKAEHMHGGFDPYYFRNQIIAGDVYLLTGTELPDTGADGEPLITKAFPIKKLSLDEILLPSGNQTLEEYLANTQENAIKNYRNPFPGFEYKIDNKIREISRWLELAFFDQGEPAEFVELAKLTDTENTKLQKIVDDIFEGHSNWKETLSDPENVNFLNIISEKLKKAYNKYWVLKGYRPFY